MQNQELGNKRTTSFISDAVKTTFISTPPRNVFAPGASANCSFIYDASRHVINMTDLTNIIRSRANKRSVGTDNIPNIVLKKMSAKAKLIISMLFNHMFNIEYFPKDWKCAITIPIPKKDKAPNTAISYRPIALLPCNSEIYERAIKIRL